MAASEDGAPNQDVAAAVGWGEWLRARLQTRTALIAVIAIIFVAIYSAAFIGGAQLDYVLSLTIWGVMLGGVIAVGSIGLTLVYGVLKFPNFSHGAMVTLGAYVALTVVTVLPNGPALRPFSFGWELIAGMIVAMPVVGLVGLAIDRVVYRRLRVRGSHLVLFAMASLAMAFFLRSLIYLIWGPDFAFYYPGRERPAIEFPLGMRAQPDQLFILVLSIIFVALVYVLLEKTRMGKAMRATADNPDLAQVRGINTEAVIAWTWIIGGALAAVGGILYGLQSQLRPEMGFWLLLPMFAAVIMGGIGSPYGALVGALIIGLAHQVSSAVIDPTYGPGVAFVLMIVALIMRPQGLLGRGG